MKPNDDEVTMIAELLKKEFERLRLKEVKVAEKITGKLSRENHQSLQSATARRTRDKILEGKIAVDLLAKILHKDRALIIENKHYVPSGGVILGTMHTAKTAISVTSVTKLKYVPAAVNRLAKDTAKKLAKWIFEYKEIYAAIVYFDVESPIFDILVFEYIFNR